MPALLEKQEKTLDFHSYPFDAEIFRKTFNGYVRKYNSTSVVSACFISAPFAVYVIVWYLGMAKVQVPGFLDAWYATGTLLFDRYYKVFSFEPISIGNFSVGLVSAGVQISCGLISIGGIVSCGLISRGR